MADDYGGSSIVTASGSDPYGDAAVIAPANDSGATKPRTGNPIIDFWNDYRSEQAPAGAALEEDLTAPNKNPLSVLGAVNAALPFANPRTLKTLTDALGYVASPIAGAFDNLVGRPVNEMTGGAVPVKTAGAVASLAVPVAGEVAAANDIAKAAKAAGLSVEAYRRAAALGESARATLAAQAAAAAKAGKAPGGLAPFAARVSDSAAERQAGQTLERAAADPSAVRASLAGGPDELVPGSRPTTFQQTGDMGLGSLERADRTANPGLYQQRAAEQNAARVEAMPQPGGDPAQVASSFRAHLDALDAETQAAVDAATAKASEATTAAGGEGTPEAAGAALRDSITDAESAARAREGALWEAIDPDGSMTGNVTATRTAAEDIVKAEPPTAQPMGPQEAAVFNMASTLPDVVPVRNLTALRSWVSTALREELRANGRSPAYARLSRLRGAIQDNLAGTIGDAVASDREAVARGEIAPQDSFEARWTAERDAFINAKRAQARGDAGAGAGDHARIDSRPVPGAVGAEVPSGGGLRDAAGDPGVSNAKPIGPTYPLAPRSEWYGDANFNETGGRMVSMSPDEYLSQVRPLKIDETSRDNIDDLKAHIESGRTLDPLQISKSGKEDGRHRAIAAKELGINQVPVLVWDEAPHTSVQPTFDAAAGQRLATATQATRERARTFGVQLVSNVTATVGEKGQFRLPDGQVPAKFFKPGPGGFNAMQAAIKAGGDRAAQILEDYAAMSLRRAADPGNTGVLDPKAFARWKAAHQDALRALPDAARGHFNDAGEAGRAVQEAAQNRAAALKEAQAGAIGKIMGLSEPEDITRAIGRIFGKDTAVSDMKALVAQARRDPAAFKGLRQAVADYISGQFIGNTEVAASGQAGIKADQFQTFVRKNSGALKQVFTDEELTNLHAIAADIQRAKRSETALKLPGGSNTAQDTFALRGKGPHGVSILDVVMSSLGGVAGASIAGLEGAGVGAAIGPVLRALHASGTARVDALVTKALLDPALARSLLAKAPEAKPATPAFTTGWKVRNRAVNAALAANAVREQEP